MSPYARTLAFALGLVLVSARADAATLCVNPGGTGGCFATIAAAAAAAPRVATIDVAAGTYVTTVDLPPRSRLTIRGAGVDKTTLASDEFEHAILRAQGRGTRLVVSDLAFRDPLFSLATGLVVQERARALAERTRFDDLGSAVVTFFHARVQLVDSKLDGNRYGVFCNQNSVVEIDGSRIVDSSLGIEAFRCRTRISSSRIARSDHDGISVSGGSLVVARSTVARSAHAGIQASSDARVRVVDSTISANGFDSNDDHRGGIHAEGLRELEVVRSTISGNALDGVAALATPLEMVASTVSRNRSRGILAWIGVDWRRPLRLTSSTIASNALVGVDCFAPSCGPITATILAGNGQDCAGSFTSHGFNLVRSSAGCSLVSTQGSDQLDVDPLLGPLAENGGPTATHALLAGSPALGAITNGLACGKPDQRGVERRRPCDAGAYESPD